MNTKVQNTGSAGRKGEGVRSDCYVQLTVNRNGGLKVDLRSKVDSLYGASIKSLIREVLHLFEVKNATVMVEDAGAVPFVIAARLEAAAKRAIPQLEQSYIPESRSSASTNRDRFRRSRLYLPGNEPHFFLNAGLHKPDCVILDLEDSVAFAEKDAARLLVRNALASVDFREAERMVRINPLPKGLSDLQEIVPQNVQVIVIPKCESPLQINEVEKAISTMLGHQPKSKGVYLLPIIESALGVQNAFPIASASKWICALAIGLEDYTSDIGAERTKTGNESLFARSAVINAAKAAGIQALDSVFSDVSDEAGLRQSALEAKAIGFDGKGCIHPRQIRIIHDAFAPTPAEIEYAQRVVEAFKQAEKGGSGVASLGAKMIDAPVVKRAQRTLSLWKQK